MVCSRRSGPAQTGHAGLERVRSPTVPPINEVVFLHSVTKTAAAVAMAASAGLVVAACGSSGGASGSSGSGGSSAPIPQLSLSQLNNSFTAMSSLKPLVSRGKGSIEVILPDTVSSTRYVEFDK